MSRFFNSMARGRPASGACAKTAPVAVARGPVPREPSSVVCDRQIANCPPRPMLETKPSLVAVARGPVPRDLSTYAANTRTPETRPFPVTIDAWRGTGPRPTVKGAIKHSEGQARALRCNARNPCAGACPPRANQNTSRYCFKIPSMVSSTQIRNVDTEKPNV